MSYHFFNSTKLGLPSPPLTLHQRINKTKTNISNSIARYHCNCCSLVIRTGRWLCRVTHAQMQDVEKNSNTLNISSANRYITLQISFALTSEDGGGSRPLHFLLYPEMHRQTSAWHFLRSSPLPDGVRCRLSLLQGRRAPTCLPVDKGPLPESRLRMPGKPDTQPNVLPPRGLSSRSGVLHHGVEPVACQLAGLHLLREPQPRRGGGRAAGHGARPSGPVHSP